MKASVIIPTYNRAEILGLTLRSLTKQKFAEGEGMEVIVVDDGSSDNTRKVVDIFSKQLDIHYIYQEDKGYRVALARNKGIRLAKYEVIVLLDAGVAVASDCISQHISEHKQSLKNVVNGYIFGYNYTLKSHELDRTFNFAEIDQTIANLVSQNRYLDLREENYAAVKDQLYRLPAPWTLFWTTNVSFTAQFSAEVNHFSERFIGWGVEDIEFGYRLHKAGGKFILSRKAAGLHYPHERQMDSQKQTNEANRFLFSRMHPDEVVLRYMKSSALKFNFELMEEASKEALA